jgi:hypothetical protein
MHSTEMWECQHCSESNEAVFDACWNCGTTKSGVRDLSFKMADDRAEELSNSDSVEENWEPIRFSIYDLLVFTTVVALFIVTVSWISKSVNGDLATSVPFVSLVFIFILWPTLRARCSNCGRWWHKRKTGKFEDSQEWPIRREEYKCNHCGRIEWRRRLKGEYSGP